jgi:hypothetical protein
MPNCFITRPKWVRFVLFTLPPASGVGSQWLPQSVYTEQPVIPNDLSHSPKAQSRAFFGDKERRVVSVRGIVPRYDQVPPLSRYPFMSALVRVEPHPHPGERSRRLRCAPRLATLLTSPAPWSLFFTQL